MGEGKIAPLAHRARHSVRAANNDSRVQRMVLLAVLFAHLAGWLVLERLARYRPPPIDTRAETSIAVVFLQDLTPAVEVSRANERRADNAMPARIAAAAPREISPLAPADEPGVAVQFIPREPALDARRLFTAEGRVLTPPESGSPAADPFAPPAPIERAPALVHESTRFDRAWTPDGENLGQEIVRKFPPAILLLQGVHLPECPPDSNHPNCEATVREQRARIPPTPQSARQPW